jgi:hypothetical protein
MDSGFILIMAVTLGAALFGLWRAYEQDKRESANKPNC